MLSSQMTGKVINLYKNLTGGQRTLKPKLCNHFNPVK